MVIMLEVMKVDVNHNLPPLFATKPFNWTNAGLTAAGIGQMKAAQALTNTTRKSFSPLVEAVDQISGAGIYGASLQQSMNTDTATAESKSDTSGNRNRNGSDGPSNISSESTSESSSTDQSEAMLC
jgi:hypothetical protein